MFSLCLFPTTVFIRLSAQGAYLIFGLSGWALIRVGRLFKVGRLFELGAYSSWAFIRVGRLFELGAYSRLGHFSPFSVSKKFTL